MPRRKSSTLRAAIHRAQRGIEELEEDSARVHGTGLRAREAAQLLTTRRAFLSPSRRDGLGHIGSLRLQPREVLGRDVTGDVVAREA